MIDVEDLRAGRPWREDLLEMIKSADIFQLCWSKHAKNSEEVEKEWRYAYSLARDSFIRPIYWADDKPELPRELSGIQFRPFRR